MMMRIIEAVEETKQKDPGVARLQSGLEMANVLKIFNAELTIG